MKTAENHNKEDKSWFAIRVTYNRELKVKAELDRQGIENFIPMHYKEIERGGRTVKALVPSVHNLIFVRMAKEGLKAYKSATALPIRYIMDSETRLPIVIPDKQMLNFMAVAGTNDEQLIYLDSETVRMKKGDKVRVTGGLFAGLEGVFMRVKGDRRVVVAIPGIVAVATAYIHQSLIQKLE